MMESDQWVVLATVVSAIATAIIAVLTILLVCENRKLRKVSKEPNVVAYLTPHPDGNGGVNIVFANVGLGLAKDVNFNIECDKADFNAHDVLMDTLTGTAPINVIPPSEKIVALFGIGFILFGNVGSGLIAPLKPFKVRISYADIDGVKTATTSEINIKQFEGLKGMMNKPALIQIHQTLKSMDKRFEVLARASHKFVNFVDSTSMKDSVRQARKSETPEPDQRGKGA